MVLKDFVEKRNETQSQHTRGPQGLILLYFGERQRSAFSHLCKEANSFVSQLGKTKTRAPSCLSKSSGIITLEDRWASNQTLGSHVVHLLLI